MSKISPDIINITVRSVRNTPEFNWIALAEKDGNHPEIPTDIEGDLHFGFGLRPEIAIQQALATIGYKSVVTEYLSFNIYELKDENQFALYRESGNLVGFFNTQESAKARAKKLRIEDLKRELMAVEQL